MAHDERVAICIPTYKRPALLRDALYALANRHPGNYESFVIVADNDPQGSALSVVEQVRGTRCDMVLIAQQTRGLACTRNRLIAEATLRRATFVAFVDDDQLVAPNWLNELMTTALEANADAVAGRLETRFEPGVPNWVIQSGYWEEPERQTGTAASKFGTGHGTLLRLSAVNSIPGPFDEHLNLTGGEDGHFFARFHNLGFKSVWCNEAVVEERVVPSRATAKWIIQREFRYGTNTAYVTRTVFPGARTYAYRVGTAAGYAAMYSLVSLVTLPFGKAVWVRNVARVARGVGVLAGFAGVMRQEYRTTHGH